MTTAQAAKQLGTNLTSLSRWAREGAPAPKRSRGTGRARTWSDDDIQGIRQWLEGKKQEKQPQTLLHVEVSRVLGLSRLSLARYINFGMPAPRDYRRAGWAASDIARARFWLDARARKKERKSPSRPHGDGSPNARVEAQSLMRLVVRGAETVEGIAKQLEISERQRQLLLQGADLCVHAHVEFRQQVAHEFNKLVQNAAHAQVHQRRTLRGK